MQNTPKAAKHTKSYIQTSEEMPWQAVPPLLIIGGAFAATGLLLNGFDKLTLGRVRNILFLSFTIPF